eukprot:1032798-Pleurochrysis_carterae.AAC.3
MISGIRYSKGSDTHFTACQSSDRLAWRYGAGRARLLCCNAVHHRTGQHRPSPPPALLRLVSTLAATCVALSSL